MVDSFVGEDQQLAVGLQGLEGGSEAGRQVDDFLVFCVEDQSLHGQVPGRPFPIVDLDDIQQEAPAYHVKPALFDAVRAPAPDQAGVGICNDIEPLHLGHLKIVDEADLSAMVFGNSAFDRLWDHGE